MWRVANGWLRLFRLAIGLRDLPSVRRRYQSLRDWVVGLDGAAQASYVRVRPCPVDSLLQSDEGVGCPQVGGATWRTKGIGALSR